MLMELDGFEENSYLVNDDRGMLEFGSSARQWRISRTKARWRS